MSFVANDSQQMSLTDTVNNLTTREKKRLDKSWAKAFSENIFPKINEKRFSVLYSEKHSRPNTPVNVIIGALLLKELTGLSDDGILDAMMFDVRYQYALHTTSFEEQPMSDRTLGRFRARCNTYELETGTDLIHDEMESLSKEIARLVNIDGSLRRMDSLMVASNIKKMSRLELLYTCVKKMVEELADTEAEIPEELHHYIEDNDLNKVIYHANSEDLGNRIAKVLNEAKTVKNLSGSSYDSSNNYQLLIRVLKEQAIEDSDGNYSLRDKSDPVMDSNILQNPADPDATYRNKSGKANRGYVGNVVEEVSKEGMSIVTSYDFKKNNYSDSQFAKDYFEKEGHQAQPVTVLTDGAYSGSDNEKIAAENNIELVSTDLLGKKPNDILADFVLDEEETKVIACPAGYEPKSCSYTKSTERFQLSFHKEQCEHCPYRDQCKPREYTRTYKITVSKKARKRAEQIRIRHSEDFRKLSNIRNGVETIPSMLRRMFQIDRMPVRGFQRCKMYFGIKVCALNINKLCRYLQGERSSALITNFT